MSTPRQMFDHALNPLKGWWDEAALDYAAPLSSNVTITAYQGRVVHLNNSKEFEMGAVGTQMPIFLHQSSIDFDVDRHVDTSQGIQGVGGNVMSGIVATAAVELETTEFDTARTYNPNDPLRAIANNTTQATGGILTNDVTLGTHLICGIVSGGVTPTTTKGNYGKQRLQFWPVFSIGDGTN